MIIDDDDPFPIAIGVLTDRLNDSAPYSSSKEKKVGPKIDFSDQVGIILLIFFFWSIVPFLFFVKKRLALLFE